MRFGGHVSLGPRPEQTLDSLRRLGFSCLQIHASSPRTWRIPESADAKSASIRIACEAGGLDLYLHAIYLINLASADSAIYERSRGILTWNMEIAGRLGAKAVTFHVGSHRGEGFGQVRPRIASAIESVLAQAPAGPALLLENSAGAGDCIGGSFSDLGAIIRDVGGPSNLGCCVDTAHAFAAGHDLRAGDGAERMLAEFDQAVGLDRLQLIHLNDSKTDVGSGRDRHENIGDGFIGEEGFARLLALTPIRSAPLILETPNIERRPQELAMLRRLAEPERIAA